MYNIQFCPHFISDVALNSIRTDSVLPPPSPAFFFFEFSFPLLLTNFNFTGSKICPHSVLIHIHLYKDSRSIQSWIIKHIHIRIRMSMQLSELIFSIFFGGAKLKKEKIYYRFFFCCGWNEAALTSHGLGAVI